MGLIGLIVYCVKCYRKEGMTPLCLFLSTPLRHDWRPCQRLLIIRDLVFIHFQIFSSLWGTNRARVGERRARGRRAHWGTWRHEKFFFDRDKEMLSKQPEIQSAVACFLAAELYSTVYRYSRGDHEQQVSS